MPSSSHVSNVNHTVLLAALATPGAGFGTVTLLVDEAQGTGNALGGARYLDFADYSEAQTAQTAGNITAEVLAACNVVFSQQIAPSKFRVCRVDTAGGESYTDALSALELEGLTDLWMLAMDSRTPATQLALAATVEALGGKYALALYEDDADWLTSGRPAAWSAADAYRWAFVAYHDATTAWPALGVAVRNLAFDPDETSVGWEKDVKGIAAYSTYLSSTQRDNAIDNGIAVMGTWGPYDNWYDGVKNFEGRPMKEVLTAAWFKVRASERLQTMHAREAVAGRAILADSGGMSQFHSVIEGLCSDAVDAKHFVAGQYTITDQPITAADISAEQLRIVVEAQVGTQVRKFNITSNLSQTAVVVE